MFAFVWLQREKWKGRKNRRIAAGYASGHASQRSVVLLGFGARSLADGYPFVFSFMTLVDGGAFSPLQLSCSLRRSWNGYPFPLTLVVSFYLLGRSLADGYSFVFSFMTLVDGGSFSPLQLSCSLRRSWNGYPFPLTLVVSF
jgi:hypothetical protein